MPSDFDFENELRAIMDIDAQSSRYGTALIASGVCAAVGAFAQGWIAAVFIGLATSLVIYTVGLVVTMQANSIRHDLIQLALLWKRGDAQSGSRGSLTPSPHSTPHAGPHGALPSRTNK